VYVFPTLYSVDQTSTQCLGHTKPQLEYAFKSLLSEGYSQRAAARKFDIPRSSARYWLDRPDRKAKPPGAAPKIPDEQIKEIIDWFTGHYNCRVFSIQEVREHFHLDCCDNTLLSAFARYGYHDHPPDCKPFISEENRLKRWSFSIANWDQEKEYWERGRYTDEIITRNRYTPKA
jgi:transposase